MNEYVALRALTAPNTRSASLSIDANFSFRTAFFFAVDSFPSSEKNELISPNISPSVSEFDLRSVHLWFTSDCF